MLVFSGTKLANELLKLVYMKKKLFSPHSLLLLGCIVFCMAGFSSCASKSVAGKKTTTSATATRPTVPANMAPGLEDDILELINKHRKSKGLPALQLNFTITAEARKHTMAMATNRTEFGHGGFSIRNKIITTKVPGVSAVAENVAYGSNTAKEAVAGWLKSPGHKRNIEGDYRLTGIGVARDQHARLYFTQIFAR